MNLMRPQRRNCNVVGVAECDCEVGDVVHEGLAGSDIPFVQIQRLLAVIMALVDMALETRIAKSGVDPCVRHEGSVSKQSPGDMI